jgi:hypothetical protein
MNSSRIAAIVYGPGDDVDALLAEFVTRVKRRGIAVAGLVQVDTGDDACVVGDMSLRDVATDCLISICQDLGPNATSCRLDPQGLAQAAGLLREALERDPALVVLNKFGKAEIEGGGLVDEIGICVTRDIPLAIGIPRRFLAAWDIFADGLDVQLPATIEALEGWWAGIEATVAG